MAKAVTGGKGAKRKPSERDVLGARRALALAEETISSLAARQAAVVAAGDGASADKLARKEALKNAGLRAAARKATGPGTAAASGAAKPPAKPAGRQAPTRKKR